MNHRSRSLVFVACKCACASSPTRPKTSMHRLEAGSSRSSIKERRMRTSAPPPTLARPPRRRPLQPSRQQAQTPRRQARTPSDLHVQACSCTASQTTRTRMASIQLASVIKRRRPARSPLRQSRALATTTRMASIQLASIVE
jgi:hypothetical protein